MRYNKIYNQAAAAVSKNLIDFTKIYNRVIRNQHSEHAFYSESMIF